MKEIKEALANCRQVVTGEYLELSDGFEVEVLKPVLRFEDVDKAYGWLSSLVSKVEEMQKALEWYADPKNYRHVESAAYSDVALDEGETARDALKGASQ